MVSNISTLLLKRDVNLRKGKMSLLLYRKEINASHIWSCFTHIKIGKVKIDLRNISTSNKIIYTQPLLYFPLCRTVRGIKLLPFALMQTTSVTVSPLLQSVALWICSAFSSQQLLITRIVSQFLSPVFGDNIKTGLIEIGYVVRTRFVSLNKH